MSIEKATPHSGNWTASNGVHSLEDTAIIPAAWNRMQRMAIAVSLGGGFLLLALLEVVFRW